MEDNFEPLQLDPSELEPQSKKNRRLAVAVIIVLLVIILAVACALLVKHYVVTTFIVDGISMYPTLDGGNGAYDDDDRENGEIIYLNKIAKIERGDIVVFTPDIDMFADKSLVKRVIGVEGDRIQIIDNLIYLNGKILDEPYIYEPMDQKNMDVTVKKGEIFCMGDNRNHSTDSRFFGAVSLDSVVGKCFMIKGKDGKLRLCK